MIEITTTPESTLSAAMDSVNLINALLAKAERSEYELDQLRRNAEHLRTVTGYEHMAGMNMDALAAAARLSGLESLGGRNDL